MDNQGKINQLSAHLEDLRSRQQALLKEMNSLAIEINRLKSPGKGKGVVDRPIAALDKLGAKTSKFPSIKSDVEKFIGENLISKIGIIIIILGVGIGAKYSIDQGLISPVTRLTLGYVAGVFLLGVGLLLQKNYHDYSSVLVSGAMAIMYFVTYTGYGFYDLISQIVAFLLMLIFTAATTVAAVKYNRQVIALIGFVGAYAVPFLLSEGSGQVAVLFIYMGIINIGILIVAFLKYWKPLYHASFGLTWVMYLVWFITTYEPDQHFGLACTFLAVFFLIFYLTAIAYKLRESRSFAIYDIILLLSNSFIFYGIGYAILANLPQGERLLGAFTLGNAVVHLMVSTAIYKRRPADRNLLYLIAGLVLLFLTIAIPVQLTGNWVTLLWAGEAAILFWIGRSRNTPFYERLSIVLMSLAFFSCLQDWISTYGAKMPGNAETIPFLNVNFLVSMLLIAAFGFINTMNFKTPEYKAAKGLLRIASYAIPAIFLLTVYGAFFMELITYCNQFYQGYKAIWIIGYTLLFVSILSFVNISRLKLEALGKVNLALNILIISIYLVYGVYVLSDFGKTLMKEIIMRYALIGLAALALVACYKYVRQEFMKQDYRPIVDLFLHASVLCIASSEIINWMNISGFSESYKLSISLLWGMYALFLIALGIWKQKKYLRIAAIVLFAVTLTKLFFFDMAHLDTIAKTIVFVSLGSVLMVISFLYNKYRHFISGG